MIIDSSTRVAFLGHNALLIEDGKCLNLHLKILEKMKKVSQSKLELSVVESISWTERERISFEKMV